MHSEGVGLVWWLRVKNVATCGKPKQGTPVLLDKFAPTQSAPKISLAAAFANSTNSRFLILESQISLEQTWLDKETLQLEQKETRANQRETRQDQQEANEDEKWAHQLDWEQEQYFQPA
ncbi:hypothetical protein VP01_1067g1 [Puccinia sorghi]|uniref:Uncharacterized protein n=1 Tax=Puccinia sorghi TaxID=27349 RepID=A0A0L6VU07_9BASI|nr:hypothetical protein VP01_1067g1 [Puccinia sorghi]